MYVWCNVAYRYIYTHFITEHYGTCSDWTMAGVDYVCTQLGRYEVWTHTHAPDVWNRRDMHAMHVSGGLRFCLSGSLSFSMCLHNPLAWTVLVYFPTAVEGQWQKKLPGTLHNMLLELPGPHTHTNDWQHSVAILAHRENFRELS